MKKVLALLLACSMIFMLTACASNAAPAEEPAAETEETAEEAVEAEPAEEAEEAEPAEEPAEEVAEAAEEVPYDFYEEAWDTVPIEKQEIDIDGVPAIIWGRDADKVILAVHGMFGNMLEGTKVVMAEVVEPLGYQVISFDMPGHGSRIETSDWVFDDCAADVRKVVDYAKENYSSICMFGDSFGAYMIATACNDVELEKRLFISPGFDMAPFMLNLYETAGVTLEQLEEEGVIVNEISMPFRWDNQVYMDEHPIESMPSPSYIFYNSGDEFFTQDSIEAWADKLGCELTVFDGGQHWLHTNEQLIAYREWLEDIFTAE